MNTILTFSSNFQFQPALGRRAVTLCSLRITSKLAGPGSVPGGVWAHRSLHRERGFAVMLMSRYLLFPFLALPLGRSFSSVQVPTAIWPLAGGPQSKTTPHDIRRGGKGTQTQSCKLLKSKRLKEKLMPADTRLRRRLFGAGRLEDVFLVCRRRTQRCSIAVGRVVGRKPRVGIGGW